MVIMIGRCNFMKNGIFRQLPCAVMLCVPFKLILPQDMQSYFFIIVRQLGKCIKSNVIVAIYSLSRFVYVGLLLFIINHIWCKDLSSFFYFCVLKIQSRGILCFGSYAIDCTTSGKRNEINAYEGLSQMTSVDFSPYQANNSLTTPVIPVHMHN